MGSLSGEQERCVTEDSGKLIPMRKVILLLLSAATLFAADVSYDGAKVHYESYGKGTDAVVFIHGWTCDLTFWRGQAPVYEKSRSLLIDLPGHGKARSPRSPTRRSASPAPSMP